MSVLTKDLQTHWASISPILMIRNEREYDAAVERLDALLDEVGADEGHSLYELLDTLGTLVHAYEEEHFAMPKPSGQDVLRFLMEEHNLSPFDLPEIGARESVFEILDGKRELTITQIRALAERFNVSPAVFI